MLFTNLSFFCLVAATFFLFYVPPFKRFQTHILIASSLLFYYLNQPRYTILLLCSVGINAAVSYLVLKSKSVFRARWLAGVGVALNVLLLCFFKFAPKVGQAFPNESPADQPGHFLVNLVLPIGISFFTFEAISLLVDSFKARPEPEPFGLPADAPRHHLLSTTLFISFFPHLVSGPILKAHDFFPQIKPKQLADVDFELCFRKLVTGYFLKTVVADNIKDYLIFMNFPAFHDLSSLELVVMLFGFSMQIFADFAGYSLIAVGIAGLFGYRLPDNFNYPYLSSSFAEFWNRWHISLSSWLREYLYFPLGGNRRGKFRTYFNLFTVMLLGGLWHGGAWSYAVWGGLHGTALAVERMIAGKPKERHPRRSLKALKILFVFSFVSLAWLTFKLPEFSHVTAYLRAMVNNLHGVSLDMHVTNILLLSVPVVAYHLASLGGRFGRAARGPLVYGCMIFMILLDRGTTGEFIYFQF